MGYGACKPRIEGIDKCTKRYCIILRIVRIIKRRGEFRCRGLDLTQNHLEKRIKKKNFFVCVVKAGFEPTTHKLQVMHLTWLAILQSAITPVKYNECFSKVNQVISTHHLLSADQVSSL